MTNFSDLSAAPTLNGTEILALERAGAGYGVTSLRLVKEALALSQSFGIGTATPEANGRLTLDRPGSNYIMVRVGGANKLALYADTGLSAIDAQANPLAFSAGSAERGRFTAGGSLLVNTTLGSTHRITKNGTAGSTPVLGIGASDSTGDYAAFYVADAGGANPAAHVFGCNKVAATNRSINVPGTVNANGADYAEYMTKAEGCGVIAKGAICGVNADGLLTDVFAEAHSFVIKSTDPAYVGGDIWGNEQAVGPKPVEPQPPAPDHPLYDLKLVEYANLKDTYAAALAAWEASLEAARQRVDRIAFSGQVPVNVLGASVGDYIVPVEGEGGTITGIAVAEDELTFAQFRKAVGKVWKVLPDGRAWVAVKVG